jgi:hypothetical protein
MAQTVDRELNSLSAAELKNQRPTRLGSRLLASSTPLCLPVYHGDLCNFACNDWYPERDWVYVENEISGGRSIGTSGLVGIILRSMVIYYLCLELCLKHLVILRGCEILYLNRDDIHRPLGARGGMEIEAGHDSNMLRYMFSMDFGTTFVMFA